MLRYVSRCFAFLSLFAALPAQAQTQPDILVLGDSQISYGAGASYLDFFNELPRHCAMNDTRVNLLERLGESRTAAIGVSSTSLHSWIATEGRDKGKICDRDERFGVNAGVYGIQGNNRRQYVQIGEGSDYQFCAPGKSAFESAFAPGNYKPKLVVLAFLGNSADRWANNPATAARDVQNTISQIPDNIPCIFLTTAPVYMEETNDMRVAAQDVIIDAFERAGQRCEPVAGITSQTRAAIEGQDQYFRRNDAGEVIDPLHPAPAATRLFLDINMPKVCDAVFEALR